MNLFFLEPARIELEEAIAYYQEQKEGLEKEFAQEVERTIRRILSHPTTWAKFSKNTRRCRTKRFPYGVLYSIRGNDILIVAVMHMHRKPDYWEHRL